MNIQLQGVQGDAIRVASNVKVNNDSSVEGQLLEVGLEGDVVVTRNDIGRKQLAALNVDGTSHLSCGVSSAHGVSPVRTMADGDDTVTNWSRGECRSLGGGELILRRNGGMGNGGMNSGMERGGYGGAAGQRNYIVSGRT